MRGSEETKRREFEEGYDPGNLPNGLMLRAVEQQGRWADLGYIDDREELEDEG